MDLSGQHQASADLRPGKEPSSTNSVRGLDGLHRQCGGSKERKFSCLSLGIKPFFRCPSCNVVIITNILSRPTNETIVWEILLLEIRRHEVIE